MTGGSKSVCLSVCPLNSTPPLHPRTHETRWRCLCGGRALSWAGAAVAFQACSLPAIPGVSLLGRRWGRLLEMADGGGWLDVWQ